MKDKNLFTHIFTLLLIFMLISAATSCQIEGSGNQDIPETKETGTIDEINGQQQEEAEEEQAVEEITAISLWVSDLIPENMIMEVKNELYRVFDEITVVESKGDSDVWIEIDIGRKDSAVTWILVPVVSFFRNFDDISYEDIKEFWAGNKEALNYISTDG